MDGAIVAVLRHRQHPFNQDSGVLMDRYTIDGLRLFTTIEKLAQYLVDTDQEGKQDRAERIKNGKSYPMVDWERLELEIYVRDYMVL